MAQDQPADPGRRQFFRRLGHETAASAGRAVGAADSLRRGGTTITGELLGYGLGDPGTNARALDARAASAATPAFSSPYRYTGKALQLLDQRALPNRHAELDCREPTEIASAFRAGVVGGGPILGEIAAYALVLAAEAAAARPPEAMVARLEAASATLTGARPNVRAIRWAVGRMISVGRRSLADAPAALLAEAESIATQSAIAHAEIGRVGAEALGAHDRSPLNLLAHGDMGPLSCGLVGTGVSIVQTLIAKGTPVHVYVTEGGPRAEGARISALQLAQLDIPHTVLADAAVAWLLDSRDVDAALLRADTVLADGDCVGPLGSASVAHLAATAGVPAYACASTATIVASAGEASGPALEVAARGRIEPLSDVAPAALLAGLITERGVLRPPYGT